jgi:hypothetical protein
MACRPYVRVGSSAGRTAPERDKTITRIVSILAVLLVPLFARIGYSHLMSNVTDPNKQTPVVWPTPAGYLPIGTFTPLTFPTPNIPGVSTGGIPSGR